MRLYNTDLPELKTENAEGIIKTCRDIHQEAINRRKRNTEIQRWDKYWVNAYNVVLEVLKNNKGQANIFGIVGLVYLGLMLVVLITIF